MIRAGTIQSIILELVGSIILFLVPVTMAVMIAVTYMQQYSGGSNAKPNCAADRVGVYQPAAAHEPVHTVVDQGDHRDDSRGGVHLFLGGGDVRRDHAFAGSNAFYLGAIIVMLLATALSDRLLRGDRHDR